MCLTHVQLIRLQRSVFVVYSFVATETDLQVRAYTSRDGPAEPRLVRSIAARLLSVSTLFSVPQWIAEEQVRLPFAVWIARLAVVVGVPNEQRYWCSAGTRTHVWIANSAVLNDAARVGEYVLPLAFIHVRNAYAIDVRTVNRYWFGCIKGCETVRTSNLERSESPAYLSEAIAPSGNSKRTA